MLGTIVSQTLINMLALVILGAVMFTTIGLFAGRQQALAVVRPGAGRAALHRARRARADPLRPAVALGARRRAGSRRARDATARVRSGLAVFTRPREGSIAITMQLSAWALQWVSCYVLLVALGLEHKADLGAAAAILFAVNVTAVLPVTPSNLGVFQAACMAVLVGAYGVAPAQALGYGIILQAVEVATAVIMGMPALVKEGCPGARCACARCTARRCRYGHPPSRPRPKPGARSRAPPR